jgi:hypothetical protein
MPNPLEPLLGDVVTAITAIAQTFDPTHSDMELLWALLSIGQTELGIEDATAAVERIYPPGYVAPATAAAARPGDPNASPAMNPAADTGEFSDPAQTGTIGDDSQNQYGGGYAGGNLRRGRRRAAMTRRSKRGRRSGWCGSTRCWTTASGTSSRRSQRTGTAPTTSRGRLKAGLYVLPVRRVCPPSYCYDVWPT